MNHLAHCYLSFGDEDLLLGNFIGDYVKGSDWKAYSSGVQTGILLHRAIDAFTDNSAATSISKARIRPFAGKFSGPMVDILYDHLLARSWDRYTDEAFSVFAAKTYEMLEKRAQEMPLSLQKRLPNMIAGDFLNGYRHEKGMAFVLERFSQRLPLPVDWKGILGCFWEQMSDFEADFAVFFPDLVEHARQQI